MAQVPDADVELVPGADHSFEVAASRRGERAAHVRQIFVDGELLYSKLAVLKFPENEDIVAAIVFGPACTWRRLTGAGRRAAPSSTCCGCDCGVEAVHFITRRHCAAPRRRARRLCARRTAAGTGVRLQRMSRR